MKMTSRYEVHDGFEKRISRQLLPLDMPEFWRNSKPCQLKAKKDQVGLPLDLPNAGSLRSDRAQRCENGFGAFASAADSAAQSAP
jgi:hypothetical protein